ncbi:hypothetical protein CEXT_198611 [Caerostris extrusa]|uniref:Uncharacterized protein n=1 Tax=Caerostris extrusa TaxID=172846 RepID=A0AAV4M598_CAEEX|nr:hypothetical protein CEXT_198611 [Caerostris extrusa]
METGPPTKRSWERETEPVTTVIGELTTSDYGCRGVGCYLAYLEELVSPRWQFDSSWQQVQPSAIYRKLLIYRIETLNYVDELPAKLTVDADLLSWKRVRPQSNPGNPRETESVTTVIGELTTSDYGCRGVAYLEELVSRRWQFDMLSVKRVFILGAVGIRGCVIETSHILALNRVLTNSVLCNFLIL